MTFTDECDKHLISCCRACHPKPEPPPEPDSRPFLAHYDGQCSECDLPIMAGLQRIILRDRPQGGRQAVHAECAGAP